MVDENWLKLKDDIDKKITIFDMVDVNDNEPLNQQAVKHSEYNVRYNDRHFFINQGVFIFINTLYIYGSEDDPSKIYNYDDLSIAGSLPIIKSYMHIIEYHGVVHLMAQPNYHYISNDLNNWTQLENTPFTINSSYNSQLNKFVVFDDKIYTYYVENATYYSIYYYSEDEGWIASKYQDDDEAIVGLNEFFVYDNNLYMSLYEKTQVYLVDTIDKRFKKSIINLPNRSGESGLKYRTITNGNNLHCFVLLKAKEQLIHYKYLKEQNIWIEDNIKTHNDIISSIIYYDGKLITVGGTYSISPNLTIIDDYIQDTLGSYFGANISSDVSYMKFFELSSGCYLACMGRPSGQSDYDFYIFKIDDDTPSLVCLKKLIGSFQSTSTHVINDTAYFTIYENSVNVMYKFDGLSLTIEYSSIPTSYSPKPALFEESSKLNCIYYIESSKSHTVKYDLTNHAFTQLSTSNYDGGSSVVMFIHRTYYATNEPIRIRVDSGYYAGQPYLGYDSYAGFAQLEPIFNSSMSYNYINKSAVIYNKDKNASYWTVSSDGANMRYKLPDSDDGQKYTGLIATTLSSGLALYRKSTIMPQNNNARRIVDNNGISHFIYATGSSTRYYRSKTQALLSNHLSSSKKMINLENVIIV